MTDLENQTGHIDRLLNRVMEINAICLHEVLKCLPLNYEVAFNFLAMLVKTVCVVITSISHGLLNLYKRCTAELSSHDLKANVCYKDISETIKECCKLCPTLVTWSLGILQHL